MKHSRKVVHQYITMEFLQLLIMCCFSLGVQSLYERNNSDCLVVSEEGQTRYFRFTPEPGENWDSHQWLVTIKGSQVRVARYPSFLSGNGNIPSKDQFNAFSDFLPGFYAFTQRAILPGLSDSLYLRIDSVNRSMTAVQCTNLYQLYESRQVYGSCNLTIFVRPTIPVCKETRININENRFEVQCYTRVYPEGICNFTNVKSGTVKVESYDVQYTHVKTYYADLYDTTCTLSVKFSEIAQWNANLTFTLTAAPNIINYQNYTVSRNYNVSFRIVRPTSVICEEVRYDVDGQYFQVQCYTYSNVQAVCSLASNVESYNISPSYTNWYDYNTQLYKTWCIYIITFPDRPPWNINMTFTVSAALNISNYQNDMVSTSFNALFRLVKPTTPVCDEPRFAADRNFFEVLCHTYVFPQGICRFTSDKINSAHIQEYKVTYNHEYTSVNKLYKTTCTLTVPFKDRQLWNTNLTFTVTAAPNITKFENYAVSSNYNVYLLLGAPVVTSFTANNMIGWVNYNEGDSITFRCTATGTPTPRLSLLNNKGAILYSRDMSGALDYTISQISCGQSNYTCFADNGWNTSDKIASIGNCPKSSSSTSSVPILQIAIGVIASVLGIVALFLVVYSCRRCSANNRQKRHGATFERISSSQRIIDTPNRAPNRNTGFLFIIIAIFRRVPRPVPQQNRFSSVVSAPPYVISSNCPPEYKEYTQRVNPWPYDDQPTEYCLGRSTDA